MDDQTINSEVTMSGENATVLAGRYRIVRQLGQGGMGSVWLAEDTKLDGFKVAIKMLPSVLVNNKRAYQQVKAEALVSLKLSHPNIATVRAFEENEGNPFLVMDYIDGLTLDEYLAKKGHLDEETTYALLEPVARALDYAHEKGIVHRDVKPGNVMVTWDGDPFVLDFGIAREIQETMTRVTGKLSSGTLLYMSPEQLKGEAPKPAQDIYSFAAMAYECLKGMPPFSRGQVEWQILNQEPESLVDGVLAMSIMRGLAKDPAQRPATCRGVIVATRPHTRPPFTASRPKAEAAKSAERTPTNKVVSSFDFRTTVLKNKWMAVALIAVGIGIIFMSVNHKAPRRSLPASTATEAQQEELVDRSELDKARIEAQVKVAACRRLDRADGFGVKIEECENGLVRANAEYDLEHRTDALRDYRAVFERSAALIALDADRQRARVVVSKMERQVQALKESCAARYASERFNAAKELVAKAKTAFSEMQFSDAADKYELAVRQFDLAIREARTEAGRLAEENRKRAAAEKAEAERRKNWRQEGKQFTIDEKGLALTLKWCPSGEFMMGSPVDEYGRSTNRDEASHAEHQRMVRITKGFWIGETEVTQGQWRKLMHMDGVIGYCRSMLSDPNLYKFPDIKNGRLEYKWVTRREGLNLGSESTPSGICADPADDVPMYYVDWYDAVEFCRDLTELESRSGRIPDGYEYRLPTRAEWEYACRAGSTTALPCGLEIDAVSENNCPALDKIAWYSGNSSVGFGTGSGWTRDHIKDPQYPGERAAPRVVKTRKPNDWGVYDMLGNVGEWCADYSGGSNTGGDDPLGAETGYWRACPGGGFFSSSRYCRPSCGFVRPPISGSRDTGFRVVLAQKFDGYPYGADRSIIESRGRKTDSGGAKGAVKPYDVGIGREPAVKSKTVLLPSNVPLEMVWCGPSEFEVRPGVLQERRGFWIAKYELTQRQWKSVMRDNPSEFQNDMLPVENLSWNDCSRFLSVLNSRSTYKFRMPLGTEWEYAARGGPKGEVLMPPDDFAWWGLNSSDRTHEGGRKRPNALGLYDVLGNVWEWCAGAGSGENYGKRELRGGSFCNNNRKWIDAKMPMFSDQDGRGRGAGLRLVCDDL